MSDAGAKTTGQIFGAIGSRIVHFDPVRARKLIIKNGVLGGRRALRGLPQGVRRRARLRPWPVAPENRPNGLLTLAAALRNEVMHPLIATLGLGLPR